MTPAAARAIGVSSLAPVSLAVESNLDLLRRMLAAREEGHMPSARREVALRKAVQKMMQDLNARRREKAPAPAKRRR